MSRPHKHPKTGVYYFRRAVPADLRPILGKREELRSLGTKDPARARELHAAISGEVDRHWKALRRPTQPLSHKQVVALSGLAYKAMTEGHADDPGSSSLWQGLMLLQNNVINPDRLAQWLGPTVDAILVREGVRTDEASRSRLIEEVRKATNQAAAQLARNANGNYQPDPDAARFPEWTPPKPPEGEQTKPANEAKRATLTGLMEGWWREAKAVGRSISTHESYSATIAKLVAFLGHDDARRVTPEDVVRFKDHRLTEVNPKTGKPASPKTVKDSDLAGLKAVFGWAVTNRLLPSNPAEGITIKIGAPKRLRSKGFTDKEAKEILKAAWERKRGRETVKTFSARRWVPWLQAYTGSRVGEMAQLRKQDLRREGDTWVLTVTPEAGTVKGGQAREIPLHDHLVDLGFPDFVMSASAGHLFLTPAEDGDVLGPLQGVKNRLTEFAREIVSDPHVQPTHGWRHRFKTLCREAGIDPRTRDVIQGHAARTAGDDYGDVTIRAMARALALFPRQG
ncbi:site-specific integrase [Microvirga roseola]|uniref:site-specific integrase n=1 Tax=Microvirga roseola TaxID=2883126 RepID=UPI001E392DA2|nr:site-specific integrase [Microvirga roseola]